MNTFDTKGFRVVLFITWVAETQELLYLYCFTFLCSCGVGWHYIVLSGYRKV